MTGRLESGHSAEWPIWPLWVLGSAFGAGWGFALAIAALDLIGNGADKELDTIVICGLIGTGVGVGQWLVLHRRLPQAGWWVLSTALGGGLVGLAARTLEANIHLVVAYGSMGAVFGVAQWLVLRRRARRAGWWLLASPMGWALGVPIVRGLDRPLATAPVPISETTEVAILYGALSGVAALLTGGLLIWLLRHPQSAVRDQGVP